MTGRRERARARERFVESYTRNRREAVLDRSTEMSSAGVVWFEARSGKQVVEVGYCWCLTC